MIKDADQACGKGLSDVWRYGDLELPADFTPHNADGEIAEFMLWPAERAADTPLRSPQDLLVLASSSFIYISVADLLPQLQQRLAWRDTLAQVAWLAVGRSAPGVARTLASLCCPAPAGLTGDTCCDSCFSIISLRPPGMPVIICAHCWSSSCVPRSPSSLSIRPLFMLALRMLLSSSCMNSASNCCDAASSCWRAQRSSAVALSAR